MHRLPAELRVKPARPLLAPRAGSSFCLGMSIFGMIFLACLAGLISEGYP